MNRKWVFSTMQSGFLQFEVIQNLINVNLLSILERFARFSQSNAAVSLRSCEESTAQILVYLIQPLPYTCRKNLNEQRWTSMWKPKNSVIDEEIFDYPSMISIGEGYVCNQIHPSHKQSLIQMVHCIECHADCDSTYLTSSHIFLLFVRWFPKSKY